MAGQLEFTPEKLDLLKQAYETARTEGLDTFVFEGHNLLLDYAKYMIEYLEARFGRAGTDN